MNKKLYLAAMIAASLSVSGLARAQSANSPAMNEGQSTDQANGQQALPDQGNAPDNRANTDYGTLEPGDADTTHDSMPSTTRNADSTETRAPIAGANSFTEAEAVNRLQSQGYTQISGLAKDDQSVWRGTAMKNGQQVVVAMDYRGNVTQSPK